MKKSLILFATAVLSFAACNKSVLNTQDEAGVGYLNFEMSSDDVVISTKAAVTGDALNAYKVYLSGVEGWPKTYGSILNQTFTLTAGDYNVYAENITPLAAETDMGALRVASESQSVTVSKNSVATANIHCVAQSSKIILKYADGFETVVTDPVFTVAESGGAKREDGTASLTLQEDIPAFYNGSVELVWTLTGTHSGVPKTYGGSNITLEKGKCLTLTVSQSTQSGELKIAVTADDELIDVSDSINIDPYKPQN